MDFTNRLAISYYKEIATINESHKIYLVQHQETNKIQVKKILDVYNADVYRQLHDAPINGVPRIIEYCQEEDQLIVIEEFIQGTTLDGIIEAKALKTADVVRYMTSLCKILKSLHALNPPLVHRDIKPSNIMISSEGSLYLLDFNAAKPYSAESAADTVLLGSPGYAAPEQYGFGSSSPQTDIYSAGIVFKEMLESMETANPELAKIADSCAKLEPASRYATVESLEKDLLSYQKRHAESCIKSKWEYLPPGFRTRNPLHMLIALALYAFIFDISLTYRPEGKVTITALWYERFVTLFAFLMTVAVSSDYLKIGRYIPFSQSPHRAVRFISKAIFCIIVFLLSILSAAIAESAVFSSTTAL